MNLSLFLSVQLFYYINYLNSNSTRWEPKLYGYNWINQTY